MSELSDDESKELMAKVAKGDRAAFDALVLGNQGALEAFLTVRLNTTRKETIAAVSQEVLIAVFMKAEDYKPEPTAKFTTWLLEIAKTMCKRHATDPIREKARERRALAKADLRKEEVNEPDRLEERDMVSSVKSALLAMPIEQREAFSLRYFMGLTVNEVAAAQRTVRDTVKSRITSVLNKLREIFAGEK